MPKIIKKMFTCPICGFKYIWGVEVIMDGETKLVCLTCYKKEHKEEICREQR